MPLREDRGRVDIVGREFEFEEDSWEKGGREGGGPSPPPFAVNPVCPGMLLLAPN